MVKQEKNTEVINHNAANLLTIEMQEKSHFPKIACVVVTFNRFGELAKTIDAIINQGIESAAIIVINNKSTDGTTEKLAREFPGILAVHLTENIASAGGFARGLRLAHEMGFDWAWLFNDDSRPMEGTLKSVSPHLQLAESKNMGLLKVSNKDSKGRVVLLYWNGARKPVYTNVKEELIQTDLITFDGCFVSRKLMDAIGYCDPDYFMGTYEFDYCLKAHDAGFTIGTLANGMIEDGKLGSVNGTPAWRQYYNTRNHLWLGLSRKSPKIIMGWLIRELKYSYSILRFSDKKIERMLFKFRAIRDAVLNKRGKTYDPELMNKD